MNTCKRLLAASLVLILTACGEDPVLEPYDALSATPSELQSLYKLKAGELGVAEQDGVELRHPDGRSFEVRALYPQQEGQYPVLLFSHGNWSDQYSYDNVVKHWVSHGYVVLLPLHLDGQGAMRGIFNSMRYGQMGLIHERVNDVKLMFNTIEGWASETLLSRMDLETIAATGHSFGAFTAQQFGGARALDDDTGRWYRPIDPSFKAVVAISPPGPMFDVITEDSWTEQESPMLATTGTWDMNKSFFPQWQLHKMSFDRAPAGDKFALVVQGMDHYLGNLMCRLEREAEPQHDQLRMLQSTTVAFLDAYVKELPQAMAYLESDQLHDVTKSFATLSKR